MGLVDPGDEVVLIEPFYDAYPVDVALAGAIPRYVTLTAPDFALDPDALGSVFGPRTKAIVVNNPHNPTGRVFDDAELTLISELCVEHDVIAICDEVYEEMIYSGPTAVSPPTRACGSGRSRSHHWARPSRSPVGRWGGGSPRPSLTAGLRAAHQFLTFTTPTPVQHGAVAALGAGAGVLPVHA